MTARLPEGVATPVDPTDAARGTAVREALTLPLLFISVIITGGFRVAPASGAFMFVAPSLVYLLLSLLVLAVLLRSGAMNPESLMSAGRRPIANVNGGVVLLTLVVATAQLFNAVTPEAGLLHLIGVVIAAMLLFNTLAVAPGRIDALRSLLVTFGGLLVFKHVLLAALADPGGSLARRAIGVLLEGITLGELRLEAMPPIMGYVAFGAGVLYFIALLLLPRTRRHPGALERRLEA